MTRTLKYQVNKKGTPSLKDLLENAPNQATFVPYQTVGDLHFNLPDGHHRQLDILAKAENEKHPSLLVECKYHKRPISIKAVQEFSQKWQELKGEISNLQNINSQE